MGRHVRGVVGLSLAASAGLMGTYVGYPGLRKAHAVTVCEVSSTGDNDAAPYTPGQLRYCVDQVRTAGGGTITFAESTNGTAIKLEGNLPEVTLTSSVTITGNGASKTILDGDYNSAFYFDGDSPVTVTVTGMTIKDAEDADGGAIQTENDAVIVVTNSRFEGNNASGGNGGAIDASGNVTVSGSTFTSNTATGDDPEGGEGGAIRTSAGNVYITGSTFTSNTAGHEGGAIRTSGGNVTVTESTLTTNTADDAGGAIRTSGGDVTVTGSTFSGNTATIGDGGAIFGGGDVTVTDSTLTTNAAGGNGGAIWDSIGMVSATNSTFTGNSATNGGAIMVDEFVGNAYLNFVTMSGNTTSGDSSGAVDSFGIATVKNSIVWDNTGGDVIAQGTTFSASYSLFSSTSSVSPTVTVPSLIFGEDPLLGSLADNGGPTQTMLPGAGSPVLGVANPAGAPSTDQRGFTRTTDGFADMGAVQRAAQAPAADLSQVPPSWHQAQSREQREAECPPGMAPSWAQWPNEGTGGWTCEYTTWWDVNEGVGGGWVTTPGLRTGSMPGR